MNTLVINDSGINAAKYSKSSQAVFVFGLAGLVSLAAAPGSLFAAEPAYAFEVVTTIDKAAPGGGAFGDDFEPTALNNRGQLAFTAEPDELGEEGLFLADGGAISQIARFDQSAPGGGTFAKYVMGNIGLNDPGDGAFAFMLQPLDFGPPINSGLYRWSHVNGTISAAVLPNVTPDPKGGVLVGVDFNSSLNNRGDVAFTAFVTNTPVGLGEGIFVQNKCGEISTIARTGDPSPDGGTFIFSTTNVALTSVINDRRDVVFEGNTTMDTLRQNKLYLRRAATGEIELIPQPANVRRQASLALNNRGDVAFGGRYRTATPNEGGVFLWRDGQTSLIAGTGDPAPGGGTFSFITAVGYYGQLALNNAGDIAFDAAVTLPDGSIDEAIYYYSAETQTLRRLGGTGTVLPGYGTVVSLEQVGALVFPGTEVTGVPFSYVTLNDRGQVAFAASATDGVTVYGVLLKGTPQSF